MPFRHLAIWNLLFQTLWFIVFLCLFCMKKQPFLAMFLETNHFCHFESLATVLSPLLQAHPLCEAKNKAVHLSICQIRSLLKPVQLKCFILYYVHLRATILIDNLFHFLTLLNWAHLQYPVITYLEPSTANFRFGGTFNYAFFSFLSKWVSLLGLVCRGNSKSIQHVRNILCVE